MGERAYGVLPAKRAGQDFIGFREISGTLTPGFAVEELTRSEVALYAGTTAFILDKLEESLVIG